MGRPLSRRVTVTSLALGAVLLVSCFPLQKGSMFPEDRNEVFLEFFDNKTFYRDLQFSLMEQIKNEILSRPGLHLTSKESADLILGGRIVDVRQRVLSEDPNRQITSERTTITVVMELRDARTGEIIKEARISETGEFVPAFGEDLQTAQAEAFTFLAREIVRQLEKDF